MIKNILVSSFISVIYGNSFFKTGNTLFQNEPESESVVQASDDIPKVHYYRNFEADYIFFDENENQELVYLGSSKMKVDSENNRILTLDKIYEAGEIEEMKVMFDYANRYSFNVYD